MKKLVLLASILCSTAFAQTVDGYLKQVNPDGLRHRFKRVETQGTTFSFTNIAVSIGVDAVDDGSGTCGTNFFVEGGRLGGGVSEPLFVPAGTTETYYYFESAFSVNGTVRLSAQQVGGCTSPAADINVTAKYTY